jgi:hypothetical protein
LRRRLPRRRMTTRTRQRPSPRRTSCRKARRRRCRKRATLSIAPAGLRCRRTAIGSCVMASASAGSVGGAQTRLALAVN